MPPSAAATGRTGPAARFDAWCGECPKCRFVFLVLAPFLEPPAWRRSSATTCCEDLSQVEGFWDLCAAGRKPYECVGEQRESLLAFLLLLESRPGGTCGVKALRPRSRPPAALVAADLEGGVPVLESADSDPRAVVRLLSQVRQRRDRRTI